MEEEKRARLDSRAPVAYSARVHGGQPEEQDHDDRRVCAERRRAASQPGCAGSVRLSTRHVPALDGLRGVALLGVLLFHANGALPGGYLGVDLFFVLSGFLITSLLLAEHRETGRIALASFWVRRARRLFPALLALMPAIAIYARCFAKPDELAGIRADALATLGYVANWHAIFSNKSYWELFAAPSPLEHTWSLAIEEQFYVVWPLLVVLLLRRGTKRAVLILSLALTAMSMAAMVALFDPSRTSRVYLGTDTRAAGILIGAALATFVSPDAILSRRAVRGLGRWSVIAVLVLGAAWWKLAGDTALLYHGGLWLTEVAACVLIACAAMAPASVVTRCLSLRPLMALGRISYGVYLWHWPINVFLTAERVHVRGLWLHVMHLAITLSVAGVSYHFIERPILARGVPLGRPIYIVPSAVALAVLLVVRATYARQVPVPALPEAAEIVLAGPADAGVPERTLFRVTLRGDSTANSLGWGLRGLQKPGVAVDLRGQDGCTMLADMCGGPEWAKETKDSHPDATLVVLGGAFMHGITAEGQWQKACRRAWDSKFQGTLTRRLEDLKSPGGQVWVVTVPYALGVWDVSTIRAEVDCINTSIRRAAASVPDVRVLELAEHVCPKGDCELEFEGATIRPDGVHYSIEGAGGVSRWVLEQIQPREQGALSAK
jgi:peptidoglycan/LPS O-acetylase OafA/YrhL